MMECMMKAKMAGTNMEKKMAAMEESLKLQMELSMFLPTLQVGIPSLSTEKLQEEEQLWKDEEFDMVEQLRGLKEKIRDLPNPGCEASCHHQRNPFLPRVKR